MSPYPTVTGKRGCFHRVGKLRGTRIRPGKPEVLLDCAVQQLAVLLHEGVTPVTSSS